MSINYLDAYHRNVHLQIALPGLKIAFSVAHLSRQKMSLKGNLVRYFMEGLTFLQNSMLFLFKNSSDYQNMDIRRGRAPLNSSG